MRWGIKYVTDGPFLEAEKTERGWECWWHPQTGYKKSSDDIVAFADINAACRLMTSYISKPHFYVAEIPFNSRAPTVY